MNIDRKAPPDKRRTGAAQQAMYTVKYVDSPQEGVYCEIIKKWGKYAGKSKDK